MQCKYCGAKLSENAKFCGVCGNKVERETVKRNQDESIQDKVHNSGNEYRWKKENNSCHSIVVHNCGRSRIFLL